jgi:predicted nuclease of restriction endonuclease-like (RecB) superfamily
MSITLDHNYHHFLNEIKQQYITAQFKATRAVNNLLIEFYWSLGKQILAKQTQTTWGSKFLTQLSIDLQQAFPGSQGFSARNLKYMRQFAALYPDEIGQRSVAQLPWGSVIILMQSVKDPHIREWYAQQAIIHGMTRDMLALQIQQKLYERQGQLALKVANFSEKLPSPQSEMAMNLLKDPYCLDFLTLEAQAKERDIEQGLVKNINQFLIELGSGFAFMGNQYKITVSGDDYFLDMLFWHVKLRAFIVVEIKSTEFKPEHAGKLNFYLAAVDAQMKTSLDNPSIGLLLCRSRDRIKAEYALRGVTTPIGISEYTLIDQLPDRLAEELPSIEELEKKLSKDIAA